MKTCLIVNFYLGERRKIPEIYNQNRVILLEKQIEYLQKVQHNLSKIVFSFNIRKEDYEILNKCINVIPKKIQNSKTEIVIRENFGMSYSAWATYTVDNIDDYDYFIYNEDDYFFIQDNFDDYLVTKFESYGNCGFLSMISREPADWNKFKKHAGCSIGITSNHRVREVKETFKKIKENTQHDYETAQALQIEFSNCFFRDGYDIRDVRDDYRIPFATTLENERDVIYFFNYNQKDFIIPIVVEQGNYTWVIADLKEFEKY